MWKDGLGKNGNGKLKRRSGKDSSDRKPKVEALHNPEYRKQVKKEPVAEYREDKSDNLNKWFFSVGAYETARTQYYRVTRGYRLVAE